MPALNAFSDQPRTALRSATRCFIPTPDDANDLATVSRMLVIAVGGVIKVTTRDGDTVTVTWPAGTFPVELSRIWSTGLTATGLSCWY
jgi:hypothetical protein